MLFDFDLIVPPGTLQNAPAENIITLTRGRVRQVRVFFPPGPATLAHVVVRHNLHQLIPANYDGTLNYDDIAITTQLDYALIDPPYEIRLLGWSPNAIYSHTISFSFDIEPLQGEQWSDVNRLVFALNTPIRSSDDIGLLSDTSQSTGDENA